MPLLEARARFCDKVGRAAVDAVPTPSLLLSQLPGSFSLSVTVRVRRRLCCFGPVVAVTVSRQVERAVKLAMSKFARINVVYTLFGKTRLDNTPVCVACDRPFSNDAGRWVRTSGEVLPGDSAVSVSLGSFTQPRRRKVAVLLAPQRNV